MAENFLIKPIDAKLQSFCEWKLEKLKKITYMEKCCTDERNNFHKVEKNFSTLINTYFVKK